MATAPANIYFNCKTKPCIKLLVDNRMAGEVSKRIRKTSEINHALAIVQTARAMQPNNQALLVEYGNCKLQQGQPRTARKLFEAALAINPKNTHALNSLGQAWIKQNNIPSARAQFYQALQIDPMNTPALNNLGLTFTYEGQTAKAREYYFRSMGTNPPHSVTVYVTNLTGQTYLQDNAPLAARKWFLKALQIDPDNPKTYELIVQSYQQEDKSDRAREWISKALLFFPKNQALLRLSESI
jgi:Tfp pilus assembly protein PilF